jgi:hypothetical protein
MLIIITQSPNTMNTTKQITTGTPTAESASRTFANLTIECGLRPNLQDLLQDKDPHIDELNAKTKTTYTYAEDDKGVKCRHSEEDGWECIEEYCLNCGDPARNCDCGDYRCGGWFCEEGSGWNDADPEGEVCCKCGETNDQKGNPNSEVEHYEELEDWYCGRCYESATRDEEEKDELNAAIDASGNCFN